MPLALSRRVAGPGMLLLSLGCGTKAPPPPEVTLGVAADTIQTTLYEATDGAWLGGDRWAVVSPSDQRVVVLDFSAKSTSELGAGVKNAYRSPFALFTAGDSLYVSDWALGRVTAWTLDGHYAGAVPAPAMTRGTLPSARDGQGNWYVQLNPSPGPDGAGRRDSARVLRLTPDLSRADTVLSLSPLDLARVDGDAGPRFERTVFSGEDAWGVLPDQSLWVARVLGNRVDWIGPDGKLQKGQSLPDKVFTITPADREDFLRRFPPALRPAAEKVPFSPVKPPFDRAFTGGDQAVWLEKSRVIPDTVRRYQVVGRDGRLAENIAFDGYGKALATSPAAVLAKDAQPGGMRFIRYRRTTP
jgi:hypothetical protein